mmetsp:Transcript_36734/g.57410  ORF Transcript_36734/g.57410 Transcript_36734/m.57410 type:complete len:188 (-) Transcript_36734:1654-2217(-)
MLSEEERQANLPDKGLDRDTVMVWLRRGSLSEEQKPAQPSGPQNDRRPSGDGSGTGSDTPPMQPTISEVREVKAHCHSCRKPVFSDEERFSKRKQGLYWHKLCYFNRVMLDNCVCCKKPLYSDDEVVMTPTSELIHKKCRSKQRGKRVSIDDGTTACSMEELLVGANTAINRAPHEAGRQRRGSALV